MLLVLDDVHWAARTDAAPPAAHRHRPASAGRVRRRHVPRHGVDRAAPADRRPRRSAHVPRRRSHRARRTQRAGHGPVPRSGRPPRPPAIDRDRTAGNPFFLGELVRDLAESGVDSVPASVRDVVASRLARLPDAALDALVASSVTGQEFDAETVGAVMGIEAEDVAVALDDGDHGPPGGRSRRAAPDVPVRPRHRAGDAVRPAEPGSQGAPAPAGGRGAGSHRRGSGACGRARPSLGAGVGRGRHAERRSNGR